VGTLRRRARGGSGYALQKSQPKYYHNNIIVVERYITMNNIIIYSKITILPAGDGVAERTKRWFDTSAAGGIFLRASHGVRRTSTAIPPPGAWQKPTGAPSEILPKHNTQVYQPSQSRNLQFAPHTQYLPTSSISSFEDDSRRFKGEKKGKITIKHCI